MCAELLEDVSELEANLWLVPDAHKGFVAGCRKALTELQHIAKYESHRTLTATQWQHIHTLREGVARMMRYVKQCRRS
jgi:hypothetical protein